MKTHFLAGAVAVLVTTMAFDAQAGQVDYVSLSYVGGGGPHVTLGITNGATTANTAVVGPLGNSISLDMDGHVKCDRDKSVYFLGSRMYFGAAFVFVDQVAETNTLYSALYHPSNSTWGGSLAGWIDEAGDSEDFVVPLNQIKAGPPLLRLDPVEEFNKAMQSFINNGGTKLEFMQQDRTFQAQRVISMAGSCKDSKSPYEGQVKVAETTVNFVIKYEGNPNLKPDINPIIAQAQPKGGYQAGYNPMTLTSGELIAFKPNFVGTCPADPKFRVTLKGGGEGQVKIRIVVGSETAHESPTLDFANGELIYDFTHHLPYLGQNALNNKVSTQFKLVAKAKDKSEQNFPAHFQHYDSLSWNYTCIPKLNVGIGGQGGIQAGGAAQQQAPAAILKVQPVNPDPDPAPVLKLAPLQAKPQRAQPAD